MAYKTSNTSFTEWTSFIRERQYTRSSAIGMGWYLNPVSNTITQIGIARGQSAGGAKAVGVLGYSYGVPNSDGVSQGSTWPQFVSGPFPMAVAVPSMPWKASTTKGHLMGFAMDTGGAALDAATVTISGPVNRTLKTDATGFFGSVDLPVGTYTVTVSVPGYSPVTKTVTVTGGTVTQQPLTLVAKPFAITSLVKGPTMGALTITWNSLPGKTYRVERSTNLSQWFVVTSGLASGGATTMYEWQPPAGSTVGFVRVRQE
jgi:hypothetical protein